MYDMHAHVLPRVDHGCDDLSMAARQMELLASLPATHAVATPHFYPNRETVQDFLERREIAEDALRAWRSENPDTLSPVLYAGAEVLASEGIDRMRGLERLCVRGTNVLLLEMPFFEWSRTLCDTVAYLCRTELRILLAHVNRYPAEAVEMLLEAGAYGQINLEAFGRWRLLPRALRTMLDEGRIAAFGSDLHGVGTSALRKQATFMQKLPQDILDAVEASSKQLLKDAQPIF